jgi:hypothetical protein
MLMTSKPSDSTPEESAAGIPPDWAMVSRHDSPGRIVLRFIRVDDAPAHRRWVIATGATYDDALQEARQRMRLYDDASPQ